MHTEHLWIVYDIWISDIWHSCWIAHSSTFAPIIYAFLIQLRCRLCFMLKDKFMVLHIYSGQVKVLRGTSHASQHRMRRWKKQKARIEWEHPPKGANAPRETLLPGQSITLDKLNVPCYTIWQESSTANALQLKALTQVQFFIHIPLLIHLAFWILMFLSFSLSSSSPSSVCWFKRALLA